MCPEGAGAGALPEITPAQQAANEQATLAVQGPLAAERLAALKATAGGRRLLAAGDAAERERGEAGDK